MMGQLRPMARLSRLIHLWGRLLTFDLDPPHCAVTFVKFDRKRTTIIACTCGREF